MCLDRFSERRADLLLSGLREFRFNLHEKSVLLKPNPVEHIAGVEVNTNMALIGAAAEVFLKLGANRVIVERSGVLTRRAQSEYKYRMNTSPARTIRNAAPPRIQMLTPQEVADRLGVSLQKAYETGRRCGLLPIVRMGRQIRVEEARLMSWIESGGRALPGGWKRNPG